MPMGGNRLAACGKSAELRSVSRADARQPEICPRIEQSPRHSSGRPEAIRSTRWIPILILAFFAAWASLGAPGIRFPVELVYNASPSMPLGWYRTAPADRLRVGMLVVAHIPGWAARLAAARGYLPITVPVIKRIAAIRGDYVCERSGVLSINGRTVARALVADSAGRPLPEWRGCGELARGEYLLLGDIPDSYDSRYFGPVTRKAIVRRAIPLWTWR